MFNRIQVFSIAADDFLDTVPMTTDYTHMQNEDAFCYGQNYLAVIDGATGLNRLNLTPGPTDAGWMAARLSKLLDEYLSIDMVNSTSDILKRCAVQIHAELDEMGYGSLDNAYPSASVSVVRILNGSLDSFVLGDVSVILRHKDGFLINIIDTSLPERDNKVIARIVEKAESYRVLKKIGFVPF
jgi:hypothetical protein